MSTEPSRAGVHVFLLGHQVHVSTHAIALLVGRSLGLTELFRYRLYSGATTRGPWFSIMCPLPPTNRATGLKERPHLGPLNLGRRFEVPFQAVALATAALKTIST